MDYDELLGKLREVPYKWHLTISQQIRSGRSFSYSPITAVCKIVTGMDYQEDSFSGLAHAIEIAPAPPGIAVRMPIHGMWVDRL